MRMSEIEKMYKLANVKAINIAECGSTYIPNSVEIDGKLYPPFTAEKQIELIKWLSKKQYVYIIMSADKEYYLCADNSFISGYNKQFDKALAMFINAYWQDLTEEEKQQVKGILE